LTSSSRGGSVLIAGIATCILFYKTITQSTVFMASNFYDKHLPDYGDLDNDTGECPGFRFGIRENDGGIGIDMGPVNDNIDGDTFYRAFLNVEEAEEFVSALKRAIERARPKIKGTLSHPRRVKDNI
jgi:hypothetical protein